MKFLSSFSFAEILRIGVAFSIFSSIAIQLPTDLTAETFVGDATRFSPDVGQPIFPAGNINVFKQYALTFDVSERIGDTVKINLLFTTLQFGGELAGGVNAAIGLEMGLCFGGNADFDLGFKPTITVPDRYPTGFPIELTVNEGLMPDSYFTTTFPPLGKAYADLIFELGAYLNASACVFGCFEAIDIDFSTCDFPPIGGYRMFKKSIRCDDAIQDKAYCSVELASFNRNDDNIFRMLNVTAKNRFEFLDEPYKEFSLFSDAGSKKTFSVNPEKNTLQISGVHRLSDGSLVNVSSTESLPSGLNSSLSYYVSKLSSSGPTGIEFQLAVREGGAGIDINGVGSGTMTVTLSETSKPSEPSIGKYGSISISAPTVNTDSRVSEIDSDEKPFTVDLFNNRVVLTALPGLKLGNKVRVDSAGELPDGLNKACIYYVTDVALGGLSVQLSQGLDQPAVDIADFGVGTHKLRLQAEFNSKGGLKSSGAEDIMAIGLDVATLVSDLLLPPGFPPLRDSGSVGPIGWNYTIASLELGPTVQLQTDFELTWDLRVTGMTFHQPGSPLLRPVKIDNQTVTSLSQVTPARTVYLKNVGANALPSIVLPTTDPVEVVVTYVLEPKLKTVVSTPFLGRVKYAALGAGASIDRVGELNIGPLIKGEHNFKLGEFTVYDGDPSAIQSGTQRTDFADPQDLDRFSLRLVDTRFDQVPTDGCSEVYIYQISGNLYLRIFDITGELIADEQAAIRLQPQMLADLEDLLDPWPISSLSDSEKESILSKATALSDLAPGKLFFQLQAAGPPSFLWRPNQLGFSMPRWTDKIVGPITNWLETISIPNSMRSYPGEFSINSDATIDQSPFPSLYNSIEIASLKVTAGHRLDIMPFASLKVWGGVIDNEGTINIHGADEPTPTSLTLGKAEAMLTGSGTVRLSENSYLLGPGGSDSIQFINYNTIAGNGAAMDLFNDYHDSTFINYGTILADGPSGNYLRPSAHEFINDGNISVTSNGGLSMKGLHLENRKDSVIMAIGEGASGNFTFSEVNHSGLFYAGSGGRLSIATRNFPRSIWNLGLSFDENVGQFYAGGPGARISFNDTDVIGGLIVVIGTGKITSSNTTFTGSNIIIGEFSESSIDEASGLLELWGTNNVFTRASVTNFGTLIVHGEADFVDSALLANNGTIVVPEGGVLRIHEVTPDLTDPNASDEAKQFPGTSNATGETLVGGTWDISGKLEIGGAVFTTTGANAARSTTSYGSITGAEAASISAKDDLSLVLSLGNPARVVLRTENWQFSALESLLANDGTVELRGGADFPSGGSNNRSAGDFINRGNLTVDAQSVLKAGGSFIQANPHSATTVLANGEIFSATNVFKILGGSITVEDGGRFMNLNGSTFASETSITISAPIIDTNEVDFYGNPSTEREIVRIDLGPNVQIQHIPAGVSLTLIGSSIRFPSLTNNLESNAGIITVGGEGLDNRGILKVSAFTGDVFTNTGDVNVLGLSTEWTSANYVQSGPGSTTRIGAGATMVTFGVTEFLDGKLIMEIGSRPSVGDYATLRGSNYVFNNRLTVDFTGRVAASMPDIGDTWALIPNDLSAPISGATTDTVTFLKEGQPLPAGWLPANSHLEVIRFDTVFGLRGLGIQVVPNNGFVSYDTWAANQGLNRSLPDSDPLQDANQDGVTNQMEYLFGNNDGDGSFPGQQEQSLVVENNLTYYQMKYIRPSGVDATYTPYYSADLENWYFASMDILDIVDTGTGQGLEWVTIRTSSPLPDQPLYFRVRGLINPDMFEIGIIPDHPLNWSSGLENFDQTLSGSLGQDVSYKIEPGRILFFSVRGSKDQGSIYGGTAPNGVDRNSIYKDLSTLAGAAVHAGILDIGEYGIVKVTFVEPQQTAFIGSTQNNNSSNQISSQNASPNATSKYSYKVESIF